MGAQRGENLELCFERLLENPFEYEFGNAFLWTEFLGNIFKIGQLPVHEELGQELIPRKQVAWFEVKTGWLFTVFGVEQ